MNTAFLILALCGAPLQQDPLDAQLPKDDLGVRAFLAAHPEYDGRTVRVAILDTGVDPGHPLLQATSTGGRKIVDWYDATSDSRVDTTYSATASGGTLVGLSGRRLTLGHWGAVGRSYRLGRIDRHFLPAGLGNRIQAERREKWTEEKRRWDEAQTRDAARGLAYDEADPEARARHEEEARQWEEFPEFGPVYDVVAFEESGEWFVIVDTDEDGNLDEERGMRSFRDSGDWNVLGDEALMNYAVEVTDGGDITHLYFDANGHGTHVAGIVAAYGGPSERLNGVAPGAELVAIKIGNSKYGGATSGFAIAKALDFAVESGCQVVNMSFGGSSYFADGHEPDSWAINEATRRGLIVVTSAGNEGPTLSTVGAPGTADSAFAIAAAIWPDTQAVNYSSLNPVAPVLFDFSSRGPLPNGSLGVSFTAPGAAVSTLPSWLITPAENFNGTSMASPQVAGCVALLLSGAHAEDLPADAARVHRAMRLAARPLKGIPFVEQGHGVVRVHESMMQLRRLGQFGAEQRMAVTVSNPFGDGAGIYERDLRDMQAFERFVHLAPIFDESATNAEKAAFMTTFRVESEAAWVTVPDATYVTAAGRAFPVRINPRRLKPGLHSTRVLLQDADNEGGPQLVVPVTVVVPVNAGSDAIVTQTLALEPGALERTFVRVPYGAQFAHVTLRQLGEGRNEIRTGAGSVSGLRFSGERQQRGRYFLERGDEAESTVQVEAGTVFEYTVASRWAVNRRAKFELEIEFFGLIPQEESLTVPADQRLAYSAVKSPLRAVTATPSAELVGFERPIRARMDIVPDPIRSSVFGGRGMFYGVVDWAVDVPVGNWKLELHTPGSIQTTELREDLMLDISDDNGQLVQRTIVSEIDTEIGALEPGRYRFRLAFPAMGTETLERRFAGASVRYIGPKHAVPVGTVPEGFQGEFAAGAITIPANGARSVILEIPDLPALPKGARFFGSLDWKGGGKTLLTTPLTVEPPLFPEQRLVLRSGPGEEAQAAADALTDAQAANAEPHEQLEKAIAWRAADKLSSEASLAYLVALAKAGYPERAALEAVDYLHQFPGQRAEFLTAAEAWLP